MQILDAQYHGRAFSPHWHEEYAVGLIVDEVESFEYRGAKHTALPKQAVLFDAGEVHTGEAHDERGFAFKMLYIPATSFREVAEARVPASSLLHFRDVVSNDVALVQTLTRFHNAFHSGSSRLESESLMLDVLSSLLERAGNWKADQQAVKAPTSLLRVRDLLHENIREEVSLEYLASEAGVSKYHLLRSFRKQFGLPPHAYQLQQRVLEVKRLIEHGFLVADIAMECGFTDQSHLNKVFRAYVGTTPGKYAEQFRTRRDRK